MMNFKTKDLMVTVLPKVTDAELVKFCVFGTRICRSPTLICAHGNTLCTPCSFKISVCGVCSFQPTWCVHGTFGCGFQHSCGPGGSACDPTIFCPGGSRDPFVIENLEDLVTLRAELQETLRQLDGMKEGLQ